MCSRKYLIEVMHKFYSVQSSRDSHEDMTAIKRQVGACCKLYVFQNETVTIPSILLTARILPGHSIKQKHPGMLFKSY